jgi:hypothetical protein
MRVIPLRDCLAGKYYTQGVEDDYEGPPNRHLEPVEKADKDSWRKAIDLQATEKAKRNEWAKAHPTKVV